MSPSPRRIGLAMICMLMMSTLGGCYLGRSPTAKRAAYLGNGALAAVGVGMIVADQHDTGDEQGIGTAIGVVPLALGVIGLVINAAVQTVEPAPARPVLDARDRRDTWARPSQHARSLDEEPLRQAARMPAGRFSSSTAVNGRY